MANQRIRTCKGCRYYDVFYVKGITFFEKHKAGFCTKRQETVSENDTCSFCKYRPQKEKSVTTEHLGVVIDDLKMLERIFHDCN